MTFPIVLAQSTQQPAGRAIEWRTVPHHSAAPLASGPAATAASRALTARIGALGPAVLQGRVACR